MSGIPASEKFSFEEYKLYYESTEKVTDRRLETNRWNYSICTAILVAIAAITNWSLTTTSLFWMGFTAVVMLCIMAILFCSLWVGQIRDFKKLNNAKFAVLNEMAPRVEFDTNKPGQIISYCPFEKEWKKLDGLNALDEMGSSKIIALKSSNVEYFIPKAFSFLFGGILIVLIIIVATNWPPTKLVQPPTQAAGTGSVKGNKP